MAKKNTNLIWHTESRKIVDLVPHSKNPRSISDKQMNDLKKSLKKYNIVEIPAIDLDGTILAGHQRILALQLLGRGEEEIEVRVPNRQLTDQERDGYLVTSNAVTGEWDYEKLKVFSPEFLVDIGFDPIELTSIWDKTGEIEEEDFEVEKELEAIKEVTTKPGDLIILGKHKILCGDCTDPNVLARLFGEDRASMLYFDPPYNINLDYNKGIGGKQHYGGSVEDDRADESYDDLISQSLVNGLACSHKDVQVFCWCDQSYIWLIQGLYRDNGIENRRVCLWIKNGQNPTPKVAFNKCYEPCVYGTRGKPYIAKDKQVLNEVMNKGLTTGNSLFDEISDIWAVKRLAGSEYEHATSKPPALHQKAILKCTKLDDIILDSFLGSGSTLIAGEQLGRRVYGTELEPVFCDLIIRRFEKLTGIKAVIVQGDEEVKKG